jgi:hypothetical protein
VSGVLAFLAGSPPTAPADPVAVSADNPLPVTLSGGIGGLAVAGTVADGAAAGTQKPVTISGVDQATGLVQTASVDATGALLTSGGGNVQGTIVNGAAGNPNPLMSGGRDGGGLVRAMAVDTSGNTTAVGNVASATTDSGAPVKIGAVYLTTPPTFTNGQRGDLQMGTRGSLGVTLYPPNSTFAFSNLTTSTADGVAAASGTVLLDVGAFGWLYNGLSFDKMAKPRTAFKLPAAAATNNAANIKTTAGTVYSITAFGAVAGPAWLKFFDTTGVPNPAALAQFHLFPVVAGLNSYNLPANGLYFPTGIGVAIVTGSADLNNVAVAAGDVLGLNVSFL